MIAEARARRRRDRRADDRPRAARARRHRARPPGPRREAARRDARGGACDRRRGPRAGVPVQVGHVERYNPAVLELGQLLREGWLTSIYAIASRRAGPFPARIRDVGVTIDLATHDADMLSWIAGERPMRVYAELAQRMHASHEDLLFGLLHFPSGATGMLDVNWLTPAKRRQLVVVGEEGMFELDYLTQRLTFTSSDLAQGVADRRLRHDVRGRRARDRRRDPRAAQGPARRVRPRRPRPASARTSTARTARGRVAIATACSRRRPPRRPWSSTATAATAMRIVRRPSAGASMLGGSITVPPSPCVARAGAAGRRRGRASPGPPAPSPSSAPARWACRSPPSSRPTAGT